MQPQTALEWVGVILAVTKILAIVLSLFGKQIAARWPRLAAFLTAAETDLPALARAIQALAGTSGGSSGGGVASGGGPNPMSKPGAIPPGTTLQRARHRERDVEPWTIPTPGLVRVFAALACVALLASGAVGCAAITPITTTVDTIATDAEIAVSAADALADAYFAAHPDPSLKARFDADAADAKLALAALERAAAGATDAADADVGAAVAAFQQAYGDIEELLVQVGAASAAPAPGKVSVRLARADGTFPPVLPRPRIMSWRAKGGAS